MKTSHDLSIRFDITILPRFSRGHDSAAQAANGDLCRNIMIDFKLRHHPILTGFDFSTQPLLC
jgi:hypothetical protein